MQLEQTLRLEASLYEEEPCRFYIPPVSLVEIDGYNLTSYNQ